MFTLFTPVYRVFTSEKTLRVNPVFTSLPIFNTYIQYNSITQGAALSPGGGARKNENISVYVSKTGKLGKQIRPISVFKVNFMLTRCKQRLMIAKTACVNTSNGSDDADFSPRSFVGLGEDLSSRGCVILINLLLAMILYLPLIKFWVFPAFPIIGLPRSGFPSIFDFLLLAVELEHDNG